MIDKFSVWSVGDAFIWIVMANVAVGAPVFVQYTCRYRDLDMKGITGIRSSRSSLLERFIVRVDSYSDRAVWSQRLVISLFRKKAFRPNRRSGYERFSSAS